MKIRKFFSLISLFLSSIFASIAFSNIRVNTYDVCSNLICSDSCLQVEGEDGKNIGWQLDWPYHLATRYYQFRHFDIFFESYSDTNVSPVAIDGKNVKTIINISENENYFNIDLIKGSFPDSNSDSECLISDSLYNEKYSEKDLPFEVEVASLYNSKYSSNSIVVTGIYNKKNNLFLDKSDKNSNSYEETIISNSFDFKLKRPGFVANFFIPYNTNKLAISSLLEFLSEKKQFVSFKFLDKFDCGDENEEISNLLNFGVDNHKTYANFKIFSIFEPISIFLLLIYCFLERKEILTKKDLINHFVIFAFFLISMISFEITRVITIGGSMIFLINDWGSLLLTLFMTSVIIIVYLRIYSPLFGAKKKDGK